MSGPVNTLLAKQAARIRELAAAGVAVPAPYAYLSHKAARFMVTGGEIYRKQDFFHYPLEAWDEAKLKEGCAQILDDCAGVSPGHCFKNLSAGEVQCLFELFHFSLRHVGKVRGADSVYGMMVTHKVTGENLPVYFRPGDKQGAKSADVAKTRAYAALSAAIEEKFPAGYQAAQLAAVNIEGGK